MREIFRITSILKVCQLILKWMFSINSNKRTTVLYLLHKKLMLPTNLKAFNSLLLMTIIIIITKWWMIANLSYLLETNKILCNMQIKILKINNNNNIKNLSLISWWLAKINKLYININNYSPSNSSKTPYNK